MTSAASESVATILCSSKQTRFQITNHREGKAKAKGEGIEILAGAKLRLKEGQRYALVGRNGTGKSTLLKAIAEKLIPGIPEETRIAILQQTRLTDEKSEEKPDTNNGDKASVLEQVIEKATAKHAIEQDIRVRALRHLKHRKYQERLFRLDKDARLRSGARGMQARKALTAFEKVVDPTRVSEIESKAKKILTGLGFSETLIQKPISSLSGGWHMRASLATALVQETDILILDEPTNFLDLLGIIWLQRYLQNLEETENPPTLILVSHDRDFISLCTDLLILKDKQLTYFHGDFPTYEASQSERKQWLTTMKEAQDKQKAHIEKSIAANMKAGKANDDTNKLRQAKSRQKKLDNRWGLQVSARGGRFKLNRDLAGFHLTARDDIDIPPEDRPVVVNLPEPPDLRFPGALISLEKVVFRYSAKTPFVVQDITLSVGMGDRIGILGLNGAGKSTLIKLLVGETRPTSGTLNTHPRLKLAYYSQHAVEALQSLGREEPALTALALLTREVEGGQVVRCELARLLWRRPHCLVLDEVTTHLDYETVTALREALRDWEGAVILVSHDRWFMRGVIEGAVDEDEESDEDADDEEVMRRRIVYRLKGGKMDTLENGVDEFERLMEKRVKKLLQD
uniref:ABC transporter domain-containing protein n=1 Tax=Fusarium oxysporum (strain Fo5176) TaxID=660025 RepID=A0A0D2XWJ5_FUSOF